MSSFILSHRPIKTTTREVTFLIEINQIIEAIYDQVVEEFFTFSELKHHLTVDAPSESNQLLSFMSFGYKYLKIAQKSEFYDVVNDIEYSAPLDILKDYVLENATNRFIGYLAYTLLSETDIEEYLDKPQFKLSSIHHSFVTFSYSRERKITGIIN